MDDELKNFLNVWIAAVASSCYCYYFVSRIPRGISRLIFLLPVFYLFTVLPYSLTSVHLAGPTIFYLLWLGNFKLFLFAFNRGPLKSPPPIPFSHFICICLLPLKPNLDPSPKSPSKSKDFENPPSISSKNQFPGSRFPLLALKSVILAAIIRLYDYAENFHRNAVLPLYCCHVYLAAELILAMSVALVRPTLGLDIEPQFNEPYLATSLQDFWGRRWNLMVTSILRPTVYSPVRCISTRILGKLWGPLPAIFATFLVSGLMHELIYFYLTRVGPTWEVTWFFVLHGVCVAAEVTVKKAVAGRWWLHRAVSGPITVVFVAVTGFWLFFPQLLRNGVDKKAIREYSIFGSFVWEKFTYIWQKIVDSS